MSNQKKNQSSWEDTVVGLAAIVGAVYGHNLEGDIGGIIAFGIAGAIAGGLFVYVLRLAIVFAIVMIMLVLNTARVLQFMCNVFELCGDDIQALTNF